MKKIYGEIILVFLNFIITILTINVTANQNFNYDANVYEDSKKLYLDGDINKPFLNQNNEQYNIDDYHTNLLGANVTGYGYQRNYIVLDDDPIVNVIPRYFFTHEGTFYSDGKEYMYYIITTKEKGHKDANLGKNEGYFFKNLVLYVNYQRSIKDIDKVEFLQGNGGDNYISNNLSMHQFVFYTVNLNDTYLPNIFCPMSVINFKSVPKNKTEVVIPIPTYQDNTYVLNENNTHFRIKNIGCTASISNTHLESPNDGLFFITSNIKILGKTSEDLNIIDYSDDEFLNYLLKLCINIPTGNPIISAAQFLIKIGNDKEDIYNFIQNIIGNDDVSNIKHDNNKIIKDNDFLSSNKTEQNLKGGLIKRLILATNQVVLATGDIEFNYRTAYSDEDKFKLGNIFYFQTIYDIYCDSNFVLKINHLNKSELRNEQFIETINTNDEINGFNYQHSSIKYLFIPKEDGLYNFDISNCQEIVLYSNNKAISINSELDAGEQYVIEIKNTSNDNVFYNLKINSLIELQKIDDFRILENKTSFCINITFKTLNNCQVIVDGYCIVDVQNKKCTINIDKNKVYNESKYFGIVPEIRICLNNDIIMPLIINDEINKYIRDQNFIDTHYTEIVSSIQKDGMWYEINTELQFLAMTYLYSKDTWISFDDGMNNDSYFIADAQEKFIKIQRNLNFCYFEFKMPYKLYLYGGLDGCGYEISNLNLNSEYKYLYLENYGTFKNITFKNCLIKAVFVYDNQYGTYENVTII